MATIYDLRINHFRGIKTFHQSFYNKKFVCLIGRGDSGKSTVLEAISYVLSSNWNLSFNDSDFYNCKTDNPILIEATLTDLPEYFIHERFGLYIRGIRKDNDELIDDFELAESKPAITIRLEIRDDLEPTWHIITARQEPFPISASARARLNTFLISDYSDRHFSWNKGNPLYSLYKLDEKESEIETNIVIDALRRAKGEIDRSEFKDFEKVIGIIEAKAIQLGIKVQGTSTSIDFKDLLIKDNKVCLHDEINIPFRLKGKGSKRLLSIAIQAALADRSGIILIDEIEQGLEPDRVQHLVSALKKNGSDQIFITTHSRNVIVELDANDLYILQKGSSSLINVDDSLQGCIRSNPEAVFAKKLIICEGKTEFGICRAINNFLIEKRGINAAYKGIRFVYGGGSSFFDYSQGFKSLNFDIIVFCDSDVKSINDRKVELKSNGINVIDCDSGFAIENQVFEDLPWQGIIELISYQELKATSESVKDQIEHYFGNDLRGDWKENDNENIRKALGASAKKGEWFKRIDHGEFMGTIICNYLEEMQTKRLKGLFEELIKWIEND